MAARRKTSKPSMKARARSQPSGRLARQAAEKTQALAEPSGRLEGESTADFIDRTAPEPIGEDDLLLLGRDGKTVYWIKKSVYETGELDDNEEQKAFAENIRFLTTQDGVVLADVGIHLSAGSACVLVNLANIRRPNKPQAKSTKARK